MSWRKSAHIVIGATLWAVSLCAAADIDGVRYLSDIKQLTSKKMKGRGSGSPELDRAAHFIAREFRRAGLRTLLDHSYLQPFPVSVKASIGANNHLAYTLDGVRTELKIGESFTPFS